MNPHVSCPFCLRLRCLRLSVFVETKRRQSTLKEKKKEFNVAVHAEVNALSHP